MRRTKRFYLAPLVAAALLVACSSEDGSNGGPSNDGDAGTAVTAQSACEHDFNVRFDRCLKEEIAPATMTSAKTRYVADCVATLSLAGIGKTASDVEACAKAVEAEECGIIPEILPACAAKVGTRAVGANCNVDAQCQSGVCSLQNPKVEGCGVCVTATPEGEGCSQTSPPCAPGTFCVGQPNSPSTTVCQKVGYVDAGAVCNLFTAPCRPGLMCARRSDETDAKCIPTFPVGEPCNDDALCGENGYCHQTQAKCTARGSVGDACDAQTPCAKGLGCNRETNKCAAFTFVEPGQACGGSIACREGFCGQGTGAQRCPEIVEDGRGCLNGAAMTCKAPAACINDKCVMQTTVTCQ